MRRPHGNGTQTQLMFPAVWDVAYDAATPTEGNDRENPSDCYLSLQDKRMWSCALRWILNLDNVFWNSSRI